MLEQVVSAGFRHLTGASERNQNHTGENITLYVNISRAG